MALLLEKVKSILLKFIPKLSSSNSNTNVHI